VTVLHPEGKVRSWKLEIGKYLRGKETTPRQQVCVIAYSLLFCCVASGMHDSPGFGLLTSTSNSFISPYFVVSTTLTKPAGHVIVYPVFFTPL